MRKKTCGTGVALVLLAAMAVMIEAENRYAERPCVIAAQGPPILEDDSDILWEHSSVLALRNVSGVYIPELKTWAQIGCSDVGIGVVFWCSEPGLIRNPTALVRDDPPWDSDCFEIMISPGVEDPEKYYHIAVTPGCALLPVDSGAEERSHPYDSYGHDASWDCNGMVVITSPWGKEGWKGVVVIPFESIDVDRRTLPKLWRMNLARTVPATHERPSIDYAWSSVAGEAPHGPGTFGYVVVPLGRDLLPDDMPEAVKDALGSPLSPPVLEDPEE